MMVLKMARRPIILFSRLNYNYKSKYLLEGNFRYDGSSKFQPETDGHFSGEYLAVGVLVKKSLLRN